MGSAGGVAADRQFEVFVAETTDVLFRAAHLMTGNASDAEDLVQETYVRVARRWDRVRSMDQPAAYARRILFNLVLDGSRRRLQQRAELEQPDSEIADENSIHALSAVEDLAEVRWAIAALPP